MDFPAASMAANGVGQSAKSVHREQPRNVQSPICTDWFSSRQMFPVSVLARNSLKTVEIEWP